MLKKIAAVFISLLLLVSVAQAHSGRTDSSGGHRDNQNASGLGSYHYHHGYGPHLHPGGICPYTAIKVSSIKVETSQTEVFVGDKVKLTATISPSNASYKVNDWSSSDESIATVNNGTVTTLRPGSVTITATSADGKRGRITIVIQEIAVEEIVVSSKTIKIELGESIQIEAQVLPQNATNKTLQYTIGDAAVISSTDTSIADLSKSSFIGSNVGETEIVLQSGSGVSKIITVQVIAKQVKSVELIVPFETIVVGQSKELSANVFPEDAADKTLAWSSSNNGIAKVSPEGVVTAISEGMSEITAKASNGISTTVSVETSIIPISKVELSVEMLEMDPSEEIELTWEIFPSDATYHDVEIYSKDEEIATVSSEGVITAVKAGETVVILQTHDGEQYEVPVKVKGSAAGGAIVAVVGAGAAALVTYRKKKGNKQ